MNDRLFDSPVYVKEGSSLIQEIACLEDALEFSTIGLSTAGTQFTG